MSNKSMLMFILQGKIRRFVTWALYWKTFAVSIVLGAEWWQRWRLQWCLLLYWVFLRQQTRVGIEFRNKASWQFKWVWVRNNKNILLLNTEAPFVCSVRRLKICFVHLLGSHLRFRLFTTNRSWWTPTASHPHCFWLSLQQYFRLTFCLL